MFQTVDILPKIARSLEFFLALEHGINIAQACNPSIVPSWHPDAGSGRQDFIRDSDFATLYS
jgi:hypothetical protein